MTFTDAEAFARDWIDAFNDRDLERIMSHYEADVQLVSPIYLQFTGGLTDTVRGIEALRDYFARALDRYPHLHFTLLEVAKGTRSVSIRYRTSLGDRVAIECFEGPPGRAASRVLCHYVDNAQS
ncbi:nuclear transport factor 2 family protein [Sphingomonas soli]|uniref:nuclear transport factor 2 family protein n=1 Tax=Sphingomonas soli TaxID=266127 RepID=UPI0008332FFC|nr:nuclear transport factor 2 family protein [Sphingomonas soli]